MGCASTIGVVTSFALLAGGAARATAAPDGESIIGGSPATAGQWPTVVGVLIDFGDQGVGFCTGTLIAPQWVLTAAHCVDPSEHGSQQALTDATTIVFDSLDLFRGPGTRVRAAATLPHPDYDPRSLSHDVGLVRLATPVTDRTPIVLNQRTMDAPIGVDVSMVGYGDTRAGIPSGGRLYWLASERSVSCTLAGYSDAWLLCFDERDGSGKCFGDSGGPSFAMIGGVPKQVGITSFGGDWACTSYGAETRVDVVYDWIADQLGGEWRCATDGECDPRCGAFANPVDADCAPCAGDDACGFHQVCQPSGVCGPEPLAPGGLGAACTMDAHCGSSSCVTRGGESLCSQACTPGGGGCPSGFDCVADDGGVCWPAAPDSGGCSAGARGAGPSLPLVLVAGAGLARRRRARRG